MLAVKNRFGKTGGNVAYHAYQSFKPGEVTADKAHTIGVALAKKLWADRFQVVVATHLDREHLHNHFVVSQNTFRKLQRNVLQKLSYMVFVKQRFVCFQVV